MFKIQFYDEDGEQESGIDGGGLFKEFLVSLSKEAFSPEFGLFNETDDGERRLFPSKIAEGIAVHGSENKVLSMYFFLGKVVGK